MEGRSATLRDGRRQQGGRVTPQDDLLRHLVRGLQKREEVLAVWADGSRTRASADAYSDVDLGVAVADDALDQLLQSLPALVRDCCDVALVKQAGRLVNVVTSDWTRADIFVRTRSEITGGISGPVEPLHDPDRLIQEVSVPSGPPPAARVREVIDEFLRFLGLLPVAVAREEWVGAYIATGTMAAQVAELMQFQNRTHRIGGALRLSERLTEPQRRMFAELPHLSPDREALVAVQTALAEMFFPLAREVAAAAGVAYPAKAEDAALTYLNRHSIRIAGR